MKNSIIISAVVCSYNRDKYIFDALLSLKDQLLEKDKFEIVIVNNNSTDRTDEICRKFTEDYNSDVNITYVIETNQGLSHARNRGIKESKGSIITFIDDDAIAEKDFLSNILSFMDAHPEVDAVGGKVLPIYSTGKEPEWLSKYIWGLVTKVDEGNEIKQFEKKYPAGCNMTIRKQLLEDIGGFNTNLKIRSDDKDIFAKIFALRKTVYYLPGAVVHHNVDDYRLEPEFIKRLCLIIGQSERIRLEGKSFFYYLMKIGEYKFKLFAGIILAFIYLMKGKHLKAWYLIKVRWYILIGFFKQQVS